LPGMGATMRTRMASIAMARSSASDAMRLIFTPAKIKTGLDVVRKMTSLQELGTRFDDAADDKMPPASFWELYDKGELK